MLQPKKIKILQIIFGDLPEILKPMVDSVKMFAFNNDYEYICISDIPEHLKKYHHLSAISDYIRIEYLSKCKNVLYADWDIELFSNFKLPDNPEFGDSGNNLMFNAGNTNLFKSWLLQLKDYGNKINTFYMERCRAYKIMREDIQKYRQFNKNTYKHFNYHYYSEV